MSTLTGMVTREIIKDRVRRAEQARRTRRR